MPIEKLRKMSLNRLINRIESLPDFGYDNEEIVLSEKLEAKGYFWRWSRPSDHLTGNRIIISPKLI